MSFIYLDYNATTPIDPRVAEAMAPFLTGGFGNPSSTHLEGRKAKAALEDARERVAGCLGCQPGEIVFTSGGSESNNLAIRGVIEAHGGGHVVTSAIEHPAVLEVVRALEGEGRIELTVVGVDPVGRVDPAEVDRRSARRHRSGLADAGQQRGRDPAAGARGGGGLSRARV